MNNPLNFLDISPDSALLYVPSAWFETFAGVPMQLSAYFRKMQSRFWPALLLTVLCLSLSPFALSATGSPDEHLLDQKGIDALKAKAMHANSKEQCYLYAQVVHQLTELSAQKYADGETESAASALRQIQDFAHKMNTMLTEHNKQLKNAEILLRHTAFRLREMMHSSTVDDPTLVHETLVQIDSLEANTLEQVFRK